MYTNDAYRQLFVLLIYSSVSTLVSSTAFGLVIEESSVQRKAARGEQIAAAERKKAVITALEYIVNSW